MMKNQDKFFNHRDIPWVNLVWEKHYKNGKLPDMIKRGSFWWRDVMKTLSQYKQMTAIHLKNEKSCLFWKDKWSDQTLQVAFSESFSFAKQQSISVHKVFGSKTFLDLFNLPLSEIAFNQVGFIQQRMESITLHDDNDVWTLRGGSTKFSSAKAYRTLIRHQQIELAFKWVWKNSCQPKHKVFIWLLLKDRLSMRNILKRKNMHLDNYCCEICNTGVEESREHLFLHCPFAQDCWGMFGLQTVQNGGIIENVNAFGAQLQSQFFMEAIILICWIIWIARNEMVFNANQLNLTYCKGIFFKEASLLRFRIKADRSLPFDQWLQTLEAI